MPDKSNEFNELFWTNLARRDPFLIEYIMKNDFKISWKHGSKISSRA
jgi:hypothetical protein